MLESRSKFGINSETIPKTPGRLGAIRLKLRVTIDIFIIKLHHHTRLSISPTFLPPFSNRQERQYLHKGKQKYSQNLSFYQKGNVHLKVLRF